MDKSNRSHASRRRKYPAYGRRNRPVRSRFASFLLACAGIFVFAVGINYLFPHFSKVVGDKVSAVVDYRSAFAVIGEGISGEKKLGDALVEAWAEAFNRGSEEDDMAVTASGTLPPPDASEPAPGGSDEFADALLTAFADSQRGYADYMTPSGMDYGLI